MTRVLSTAGVVILACLVAATSPNAQTTDVEEFSLTWDSCLNSESNLSQDFTGPGIYHQGIVAKNLTQPFVGLLFLIEIMPSRIDCYITPDFPDAWRFEPGGCEDGKVGFSADGFSTDCPGLEAVNREDHVAIGYEAYGGFARLGIEVWSTFDAFQPNPLQTYTLGQVLYDMGNATIGPGEPNQVCGGAEVAMCMRVQAMDLYLEDGSRVRLRPYWGCNTWQSDFDYCECGPWCDQNLPSTWGKLKSLYR